MNVTFVPSQITAAAAIGYMATSNEISGPTSVEATTDRGSSTSVGRHPRRRRKVFYLVDSFDMGGTETQAVELALRIGAAGYEVTLGSLRAEGVLLERLKGASVEVLEFHPRGGIDSPGGIYQVMRLSWFLRRHKI